MMNGDAHLETEELNSGDKNRIVLVVGFLAISTYQRSKVIIGHSFLILPMSVQP